MATVKGTWKFNDVLTYAGYNEVAVNFTAAVPVGDMVIIGQCDFLTYGYNLNIRVVSSDPDLSAMGFPLPLLLSVYDPEADIPWEYDLNYIDFGTEPQSVSAEFYNWLTANATELVDISGKWRFREVLTPPADAFKETVSFLNGGDSFNAMYAKTVADTTGFGLEFSKITASGGEILLAYADGAYGDLFAVSGWADDTYRTVDFGTESQAVSVEFYNWLTGNAVQSNGSLLYRGETIAELFPGQTVTLKCGGMRMEDDVVVRV